MKILAIEKEVPGVDWSTVSRELLAQEALDVAKEEWKSKGIIMGEKSRKRAKREELEQRLEEQGIKIARLEAMLTGSSVITAEVAEATVGIASSAEIKEESVVTTPTRGFRCVIQ